MGNITRRQLLGWAATAGAGLALGGGRHPAQAAGTEGLPSLLPSRGRCGRLHDIDHIVILMQENRSFDQYFGTARGVRGFADAGALPGVFEQAFPKNRSVAPVGRVLPYHLDISRQGRGECTPDPTHGWGPQHASWNNGAMDGWGAAHAGDADWSFMGYYARADLPYLHAVADAFTVCDAYHCSVMGSTTSNRLYSVSAWLDPAGVAGGPVTSTIQWDPRTVHLRWETYPERLTAAGVSWRAYSSPDADVEENPLVDFQQFYPGHPRYRPAYTEAVFGHTYADFLVDAAAGTLPQVSWVLTSIVDDEHPSAPPQQGQFALEQVVTALTANPLAWAKTALIWTYDENGGYFDHVVPPTAPPGTPGEWITAPGAADPAGPIGLGFRVPTLVISPFSKGGFVCHDTFDHTSTLRLIETRFGVEVPHLTPWRRSITGDLTSAFNFATPDFTRPTLPIVGPTNFDAHPECITEELTMAPSPTPTQQTLPHQEPGTRPSPSGVVCSPNENSPYG